MSHDAGVDLTSVENREDALTDLLFFAMIWDDEETRVKATESATVIANTLSPESVKRSKEYALYRARYNHPPR